MWTSASRDPLPSKGKGPSSKGKSVSSSATTAIFEANGWTLLLHPCFLEQLEKLTAAVETERRKHGEAAANSANSKVLRQIIEIAFEKVPQNPAHPDYRQGKTLGSERTHWFRAKFGGGRYRLFFRYSTAEKIIIYAWVNDEDTLRTYGKKTDAYREFSRRLDADRPPDSWTALKQEASSKDAIQKQISKTSRPAP